MLENNTYVCIYSIYRHLSTYKIHTVCVCVCTNTVCIYIYTVYTYSANITVYIWTKKHHKIQNQLWISDFFLISKDLDITSQIVNCCRFNPSLVYPNSPAPITHPFSPPKMRKIVSFKPQLQRWFCFCWNGLSITFSSATCLKDPKSGFHLKTWQINDLATKTTLTAAEIPTVSEKTEEHSGQMLEFSMWDQTCFVFAPVFAGVPFSVYLVRFVQELPWPFHWLGPNITQMSFTTYHFLAKDQLTKGTRIPASRTFVLLFVVMSFLGGSNCLPGLVWRWVWWWSFSQTSVPKIPCLGYPPTLKPP